MNKLNTFLGTDILVVFLRKGPQRPPVQPVPPPPFLFLFRTAELAKANTSARDRHALQQLALTVHIKHSDLT